MDIEAPRHRLCEATVAFRVLATVALVLMTAVSFDYGITGDEPDQDEYGHLVYAYYRSGFTDRAALEFKHVYLYGALFDVLCVVAQHISPLDRFDTRHLLNAIVGWAGMVYAARAAGLLMGPRASCIALLMLVVSPQYFAHCMNNPKDIPFATAHIAAVFYLLSMRSAHPFAAGALLAKIAAACACAIGVRFGGLLLVGYLWLALGLRLLLHGWRRFGDVVGVCALAVCASILAVLAGTLFCPWAIQAPLIRPFVALSTLSHFPDSAVIPVLFAGHYFFGSGVPATYVPTLLAITTPITILVAGLASVVMLGVFRGERLIRFGMLWFALVFPVLYVIASHAALYNGLRHLLFVYPILVILAAVACEAMLRWAGRRPRVRWGVVVVLGLGLADPLRFHFVNHPNQTAYFNSLVGGLPGAFGRFDVDYWGNSIKQALQWTMAQGVAGRPIHVTGPEWPLRYVMGSYVEQYPRLRFAGVRKQRDADYWVEPLFFDRKTQEQALRSGTILHAITADGVPLCLIKAGGRAVD